MVTVIEAVEVEPRGYVVSEQVANWAPPQLIHPRITTELVTAVALAVVLVAPFNIGIYPDAQVTD